MEIFKVGDKVYTEDLDTIDARIVEIKKNIAYVEFRTAGGGGCLPFELSELHHEKWCITTNVFEDETQYLAWQKPGWNEDGYFWTSRNIVEDIIKNNTSEHPFLFNSRRAAIKYLKSINIPQRCKIVRF